MLLITHYMAKLLTCAVMITALLLTCSPVAMSKTITLRTHSVEEFQDTARQRFWQVNRSKKIKTIEEVSAYLTTLNQGKYDDWRLPTKLELFQLFSDFDLKRNGNLKIRLEGSYWLLDDMGQAHVGAWEIGDQCGPSRTFYKGKAGYLRAIRP